MKMLPRIALLLPLFILFLLTAAEKQSIPEIQDYPKWKPLQEKIPVTPELFALCRPPLKSLNPFVGHPGISKDKSFSVSVYGNATAWKILSTGNFTNFPVGSVIVKQKLLDEKNSAPDSLGIMIKRSAVAQAEGGWEFVFVDSGGKISRGPKELSNCYDCHSKTTGSDYVFGTYLKNYE